MLQEESYFIDVHYDALYDDIYFVSRYRFGAKELVAQFVNKIETQYKNVMTSTIGYEKEPYITGYTDDKPYRPRFTNIEEGIIDLEQMMKYCNNYSHADKSTYKYHSNIFTNPIKEYELMFLHKEKEILKKENEEKKKENEEMKKNKYKRYLLKNIENTNLSIQELNKIIEICQNKINELNK